MASIQIYLTFNGKCEEAFEFYRSVFGGEFSYAGYFRDMPQQEGQPPIPEELGNKIMHISLPISEHTALMGSDAGGEWGQEVTMGNNFSISVNADSREEADRIFSKLAEGGTVTMPLAVTFWQSYFGMLTDKFGINWMMSYELPEHKNFEKENKIVAN